MGPFLKRRAWLLLASLVALLLAEALGCASLGGRAKGARLARMRQSPQWAEGQFTNPQPLANDYVGFATAQLRVDAHAVPEAPPPHVLVEPGSLEAPPASGLRVTWFGHSSVLLEVDGYRVLLDPVWSESVGPTRWLGPPRWMPPLVALERLPRLDAVVISHDHYDHLDYPTVVALAGRGVPFIVPLGVGAHLARWGVPAQQIIELDWWEHRKLGALEVVCTPARHASGRRLIDADATLWAGYAFLGPQHRAYFSGDTGLFSAMRDIGSRLGPFDLTMIEVGQYDAAWPDWHIGPEQAVVAHQRVRGKVMLPIHWGLFQLASHGWTEPIERAWAAAQRAGVVLVAPRPGESVDPTAPRPVQRWWPALPWRTAEQAPIVSTHAE